MDHTILSASFICNFAPPTAAAPIDQPPDQEPPAGARPIEPCGRPPPLMPDRSFYAMFIVTSRAAMEITGSRRPHLFCPPVSRWREAWPSSRGCRNTAACRPPAGAGTTARVTAHSPSSKSSGSRTFSMKLCRFCCDLWLCSLLNGRKDDGWRLRAPTGV
jgi:hypothetical protein